MTTKKAINVGIIGGAGYAGGELIRLLLNHPLATISLVQSTSSSGKFLYDIHHDLLGATTMKFSATVDFRGIEVIFLCSGHGAAKAFLEQNDIPESVRIIDLSQDFRLAENANQGSRKFVYGLPERNKSEILQSNNIANPGCFATAIQLGLLPLAAKGLVGTVHTTGITGSTGAGQSLSPTTHFSWRSNNIQAYKALRHQHLAEVMESLSLVPESEPVLHFVPWRGDFARGIFVSSVLDCILPYDEVFELYAAYYLDALFTHVSDSPIDMKRVANTNNCCISLEKSGDQLIVHSAIDNLLKGASGQAVQNMNLLFGLPENAGLQLKASVF